MANFDDRSDASLLLLIHKGDALGISAHDALDGLRRAASVVARHRDGTHRIGNAPKSMSLIKSFGSLAAPPSVADDRAGISSILNAAATSNHPPIWRRRPRPPSRLTQPDARQVSVNRTEAGDAETSPLRSSTRLISVNIQR